MVHGLLEESTTFAVVSRFNFIHVKQYFGILDDGDIDCI